MTGKVERLISIRELESEARNNEALSLVHHPNEYRRNCFERQRGSKAGAVMCRPIGSESVRVRWIVISH